MEKYVYFMLNGHKSLSLRADSAHFRPRVAEVGAAGELGYPVTKVSH